MTILYKNDGIVTTKIDVDYSSESVKIDNYSDNPIDLAFGVNKTPSFNDFLDFLESRCFPKTRDNLKLHLDELGIDNYNPLLICKKTEGRLEGDLFSLEFV